MRTRRWVAVIAAIVLAGGGVYLRQKSEPAGHVDLPAVNASAEEVVRVYAAALNAGDGATAAKMSTPSHTDSFLPTKITSMTLHKVLPPVEMSLAQGYRQAIFVPVDMTAKYKWLSVPVK